MACPNLQRSWSLSKKGPPTTRTSMLPELGPSGGKTPSIVTSSLNSKVGLGSCEKLACGPAPLFETARATSPAVNDGGLMHTMVVLLRKRAAVTVIPLAPPNRHVSNAELRKFSPRTMTSVPPSSGPWSGSRLVTRTTGKYSKTTPLALKS